MKADRKESRVRSRARRLGYRLMKSRKSINLDNFGDFMLVDENNCIVLGSNFDATLNDVEEFLAA